MTVQPRRGRGPWFWVALGCGGCLVLSVIGCVLMFFFSASIATLIGSQVEGNTTNSWSEAAGKTEMHLYEPTYLPTASGTPEIVSFGVGSLFQTVTASYPGSGLLIVEINRNPQQGNPGQQTEIEGADEAYLSESGELIVRKDTTWITLSNAPEDELRRVAESLRRVE